MTAQGGDGCAAIGGGYNNTNKTSGNIVIQSGIITATGGDNAAGIGTGEDGNSANDKSSCGDITISGGIVTATGGSNAPGIGSGLGSSGTTDCSSITITNGVNRLITIKGSNAPDCIGKGYGGSSTCGTVKINGIEYWNGSYQKDGATYLNQSKITLAGINSGSVNFEAPETPEMQSGELWLVMGDGTSTSNQIWITDGATVALSNVNISNQAFDICCLGDATVILAEGTTNTLTSTSKSTDMLNPNRSLD